MKRITLTVIITSAVGAAGRAQTPPVPKPVPAAPVPATPTPAPRAIAPIPPVELDIDIHPELRAYAKIPPIKVDLEHVREQIEAAQEMAYAAAAHFPIDVEIPHFKVSGGWEPAHRLGDIGIARPFFEQGDPADSLYRAAHDALNRGDYGRAAALFKQVAQKYPKSVYENDLPYWEAVARYRIGTTEELRNAAKLLEPRASKAMEVVQAGNPAVRATTIAYRTNGSRRGTSDAEAAALYVRINRALAARGDNGAAAVVARAAQTGANICDADEMRIKAEAINALSQMDPTQAMAAVRRVLDQKDDCSTSLRKTAVFVLGRRGDNDAANLLAAVAKSDPSTDVRVDAISWLPKVQGEAGINMLEELLRADTSERVQRAVVRTLISSGNARARSSMRALIDRKDAPTSLRVEAVNGFSNDRSTSEDAAYLRGVYGRVDNDRVKEAIISTLARLGGSENEQWVLNVAKNTNEPSQLRSIAISRVARSSTISVADLIKLYDASDTYDVRRSLVSVFESRREPEAADKLVDIVRNSTVPQIRNQALNALKNRKDQRSAQLYLEIIDGKRP